jgi:hypothetical protein
MRINRPPTVTVGTAMGRPPFKRPYTDLVWARARKCLCIMMTPSANMPLDDAQREYAYGPSGGCRILSEQIFGDAC